ncbi:MAG: hypothetical protein NVSMB47_15560 [Polyangiales bacterium]
MAENHAQMFVDGHEILPAVLDDLGRAERVIDLSMFLFFRDPIGEQIGEAIAKQARRGVAVRVLMNMEKTQMGDPFSTGEKEMMRHDPNVPHDPMDVAPLCKQLREAGCQVIDTNIDYAGHVHVADPRLRSIAAQIRDTIDVNALHIDHRKVIAIDGRVGWCGGANVGAQYMFHAPFDPHRDALEEARALREAQPPEPWWKWHDSLTRVEGPIVRALDVHVHDRWVLDGGDDFQTVGADSPGAPRGLPLADARVVTNEPNDHPNPIRALYLQQIADAERSIFIENPYTYHPAIADALVEAKRRRPSLRVELVLPARDWNDNSFGHDAQQYFYARYLEAGIELHEYQNHFNHLKMAVFDERWSIHGSTNLNFRSLEDDKDFELVVLCDSVPLARDVLARVRDVDVRHSRRFTAEDLADGLRGMRIKTRDPRTLLLISRKVL